LKNLSNNPWFIACLALFAIVYLVVSVGGLILDDEAQAYVPIDADASSSTSFSGVTPQVFDMELLNIAWLDDVSRDPFGVVELPPRGSGNDALIADKILKLDAIFIGESTRMAVINQRLVREGDAIGSYRVLAIKRSQVILAWDNKRLVLEALL